MNELEKSVRREMKYYESELRAGGWYGFRGDTGWAPKYGTIHKICADYDFEEKIVTDIRIYTYGEAMERRDYYNDSINITTAFYGAENSDGFRTHHDWDTLINDICMIVKTCVESEEYESDNE